MRPWPVLLALLLAGCGSGRGCISSADKADLCAAAYATLGADNQTNANVAELASLIPYSPAVAAVAAANAAAMADHDAAELKVERACR